MGRQQDNGSSFLYWRGSSRGTTKAILPPFVTELDAKVCSGPLKAKLDAIRCLARGDVVVIDSWGKDALLLSIAKAFLDFYLVLRLRGDPMASTLASGRLMRSAKRLLTSFILGRVDVLVFNSQHVRSQQKYRKYAAKSSVIYNPLIYTPETVSRPEQPLPHLNGLRILSVVSFGWMRKIRPLGECIEHWIDAEFMRQHDITWTICGLGEDTEAYRWFVEQVAANTKGGRVRFIGYQKDMPRQYAASNVLVHISGLEAFPNAVLEASYFELPTITTPTSGGTLEAVVDGTTGRIVADGPAFREAILDYQRSLELRRRHGRAARHHVESHFSIASQKAGMTALLNDRFGAPEA